MAGSPANSHGNGYPLGLAGAVSATRYVGGTATVAPTTGTFAVGDFVISQNGKLWVCTVAGAPGTWVQVGAGGSGTVTSVTAADGSIVVGGTAADPTVATGTLDAIAAAHAPAANWSNNSKKITAVTPGAAAGEAAVYEMTPTGIMTTKGDTLYESANGVASRLAVGAAGQIIRVGAASVLAYAYPPGYLFDRATITSNGTSTQTVESSATTIITGASVTYDGATTVRIIVTAEALQNSGLVVTFLNIWDSVAGDLGRVAALGGVANAPSPLYADIVHTPSAAAHVYTVRMWVSGASTGTIYAGAGGAGTAKPAEMRIEQV